MDGLASEITALEFTPWMAFALVALAIIGRYVVVPWLESRRSPRQAAGCPAPNLDWEGVARHAKEAKRGVEQVLLLLPGQSESWKHQYEETRRVLDLRLDAIDKDLREIKAELRNARKS